MVLALIACAVLGGAQLALGVASRTERLPRNYFAGIKTGRLLSSDEAWRTGHRAAAPLFLLIGAVGVVLAVVIAVISPSEGTATTLMLVYVGFTLVGLAAAAWAAHRAVP